ncbi:MAG TPA: ester cyclase [Thermoleophilia bacterium]|nr:ester cyclase [Thermoleophilia bacterium]
MSAEHNAGLVRRVYEEGWAYGSTEVFADAFAETHVVHWHDIPPSDQKRTVNELVRIVRAYRAAFPDLRVSLDHLVAQGDHVAVQVTFAGTHTGEYEGFAPTGIASSFTDMQVMRLAGGRIVETDVPSGGLAHFFRILDGTALA